MDPEGDLAEVVECGRESVHDAAQLASVLLELLGNCGLRCAQGEREPDQLLLCAGVQVALAVATIRAREASSSARPSALAIAVARSWVNFASRSSRSAGSGSASRVPTAMTPQRARSTTTGTPTA